MYIYRRHKLQFDKVFKSLKTKKRNVEKISKLRGRHLLY